MSYQKRTRCIRSIATFLALPEADATTPIDYTPEELERIAIDLGMTPPPITDRRVVRNTPAGPVMGRAR